MSNLNNHDEKDIKEDDDDEDDDDYVPTNDNESEEENENLKNELVEDRLTDNEEEDDDYQIKNKKPKLIKNDDDDDDNDESKSKKTDEIWSSFKNDVKSASPITNTCSKEIGNINNTQINNTVATSKSITSTATTNLVKTRPKSGIAGILNKINKQPKISTLEKSRLDWEEFKKSENIEDDLTKHSKGKESYLERRAFLERADYREYEIEKGLRTKERKLRESH